MKKPDFRPLAKEDFPSEAAWIDKLIRPLNTVLGAVAAGLGNGLTLGENLNAEVKTIDITTRDEWTSLTLGAKYAAWSSAAHYQGVAYRFVGGDVELRGLVDPQAGVVNTDVVATLPVGARPAKNRILEVAGAATAPAHVSIGSDGAIHFGDSGAPTAGLWISFDGVRFQATGPTAPNPAFPVKFTTKVKGRVVGVQILRCVELSGRNELPVNDSLSAGWAQDGQSIQLTSVAGLAGGRTYRLTLAIIGG